MSEKYLRVGVLTNFNFSEPEIQAIQAYADKGWKPLLNTNAKTQIVATGFPVVVTINPDVVKFEAPRGDLQDIAAVRIKFVASKDERMHAVLQQCLAWADEHAVPVLLTMMRFKALKTAQVCHYNPDAYHREGSWLRLKPEYRARVEKWIAETRLLVCDENGTGCPDCRNCSWTTYGSREGEIWGLDLSTSGVCPYSCPDCFAKSCLNMCGGVPAFDRPKKNRKQKGEVKHAALTRAVEETNPFLGKFDGLSVEELEL